MLMWAKTPGLANTTEFLGKFLRQLFSDHFVDGLRWCFDRLNMIEVDYLRVKPICKVTGEFWAQTTESDGNFNMFPFLDREGAQMFVNQSPPGRAISSIRPRTRPETVVACAKRKKDRTGMKSVNRPNVSWILSRSSRC